MADIMAKTFLSRLAEKSRCFQALENVYSPVGLSASNYKKFEENIGSSRIRANVLDQSATGVLNTELTLAVIINNITFDHVSTHTQPHHFSSGVAPTGWGVTRLLGVRFDYVMQDINTLAIVAYGSVAESRSSAFTSNEGQWSRAY